MPKGIYIRTEYHKKINSKGHIRYYKEHPEVKEEHSKRMQGKNNPMYGKHHSEESKQKNRDSSIGQIAWNKGISHTKETIEKIKEARAKQIMTKEHMEKLHKGLRGEDSSNWKGGITPLHINIRNLLEYKQWREAIFERDNYICQECGLYNGCGKAIHLEAHHCEKSFSELYAEFLQEYDQFSPYEDIDTLVRLAMKWQPFWIAKGKTLCNDCHKLTRSYGNRK